MLEYGRRYTALSVVLTVAVTALQSWSPLTIQDDRHLVRHIDGDAALPQHAAPLPGLDAHGRCLSHDAVPEHFHSSTTQTARRLQATPRPKVDWDRALRTAHALVANMSFEEKATLVRGVGWDGYNLRSGFYVGSIPAIPRLGLPSLTMHDASQGFRTIDERIVGTVTAWPCQLALAATWDRGLVRQYGEAIGLEFRRKGANVALGPGINIARVARNGRIAEYLTGEEPSLGAALASAYVEGVQSRGVAAVAKHFVANSQETLRHKADAVISERALREIYYPPFEGAISAGVAAVMCAYNSVNGQQACTRACARAYVDAHAQYNAVHGPHAYKRTCACARTQAHAHAHAHRRRAARRRGRSSRISAI